MAWTIDLPRELDGFVERMIVSGRYGSVGDLVTDALGLLKEQAEEMAEEERLLLDHSDAHPGDDVPAADVFSELRAKVEDAGKRLAAE